MRSQFVIWNLTGFPQIHPLIIPNGNFIDKSLFIDALLQKWAGIDNNIFIFKNFYVTR